MRCQRPPHPLPQLWSRSQEVTGETTRVAAWMFQSCLVSLDIFWNSDSRHILAIVSCTVNPSRVRNCLHSCSELEACCCLNNQQEHLLSLALPLIAGEGIPKCQSSLHQDSIHTWKAFQIDAGKDRFSVGYTKEYRLILLLSLHDSWGLVQGLQVYSQSWMSTGEKWIFLL